MKTKVPKRVKVLLGVLVVALAALAVIVGGNSQLFKGQLKMAALPDLYIQSATLQKLDNKVEARLNFPQEGTTVTKFDPQNYYIEYKFDNGGAKFRLYKYNMVIGNKGSASFPPVLNASKAHWNSASKEYVGRNLYAFIGWVGSNKTIGDTQMFESSRFSEKIPAGGSYTYTRYVTLPVTEMKNSKVCLKFLVDKQYDVWGKKWSDFGTPDQMLTPAEKKLSAKNGLIDETNENNNEKDLCI
jgi:hypothetical protein